MWQGLTTPSLGKSHVKQDKKMHDYVGYKENSHYLCIAYIIYRLRCKNMHRKMLLVTCV